MWHSIAETSGNVSKTIERKIIHKIRKYFAKCVHGAKPCPF